VSRKNRTVGTELQQRTTTTFEVPASSGGLDQKKEEREREIGRLRERFLVNEVGRLQETVERLTQEEKGKRAETGDIAPSMVIMGSTLLYRPCTLGRCLAAPAIPKRRETTEGNQ
jgi:hypothetical protein